MAFIDYYKILGVSKDIPQKDVRRAYLKRAKQFHPDLHPDDPKAKAKFQALNEAYEVISDPEKRKKYDQYGQNWKGRLMPSTRLEALVVGRSSTGALPAALRLTASTSRASATEVGASPASSRISSATWGLTEVVVPRSARAAERWMQKSTSISTQLS